MATITPFKGIRPAKQYVEAIAELPYDVYNREEARALVERRPDSFLAIDRPETQFPADYDMYADEVYEKAHDMLWEKVEKRQFTQDVTECYYIYQLIMNGRKQTGICACASIDDYVNGVIKKHENTRAEKEKDRIRHVSTCEAQTGPIFLAYRANESIHQTVERCMEKEPCYDFIKEDGIGHKVWVIDNPADIEVIRKAFAETDNIYIADGHHRCASAAKVGLMRREAHPDYTGKEEFNSFLAVLFPDDELMIMDYNRVVKDLNGYTAETFLEKIGELFEVTEKEASVKPTRKGTFGMFIEDKWYELRAKEEMLSEDPVEGLDVSILQKNLLEPVLGILDPKTDERIDFVGGIRGMEELERRVHTDCKVAFSMYPTSIGELFDVADAGLLMPPKSTWFEPKLLSGLFIHDIRTEV